MGLYKRKDVWWMSFTTGNRQYKKSTGTNDKRLAEKIYDILKGKLALGQWMPETEEKQRYTFKELAGEYLKWCERQRSFRSKRLFLNQLVDTFGHLQTSDINTILLEQFQVDRLSKGRLNKGNKPATVNRLLATLKHCIHKGYQWDMVSEETLKRVRQVKLLPENNKRERYLSLDECQELIRHCDSHLKPIVQFALNTGCRKGEFLGLRWNEVDLKQGLIYLVKTKNGESRVTPINDTLRGVLQGLTRRLDSPYVFHDAVTGKPYGDVKRSFQTALRRAGIKDFNFHDLRHTFASHLVMAGVDITTVSRLLGHKSLTMTLRYSHLAPEHLLAGIKKLDDILSPQKASFEGQKEANYTNFRTLSIDSKKESV